MGNRSEIQTEAARLANEKARKSGAKKKEQATPSKAGGNALAPKARKRKR